MTRKRCGSLKDWILLKNNSNERAFCDANKRIDVAILIQPADDSDMCPALLSTLSQRYQPKRQSYKHHKR